MNIAELKETIKELESKLYFMKNDPLSHDDLRELIEADHACMLFEEYAHVLDQLPFYVCSANNARRFADWVNDCDQPFFSQSLNDFADCYDIENTPQYQEIESEIEDLKLELEELEQGAEDE